ncbi:hypothetical protein [Ornithinimicrobium murale]|uniref:hypothetical protein n=1 Tax=Ornithinimicrobium murale TaxID=1050153 RepID=UPI0013B3C522|nr:hypothetical protein [Ornithinimicrobium murale]
MTNATTQEGWSRRRLLAILAVVALVAVMLLVGLGLAVWQAFTGGTAVAGRPADDAVATLGEDISDEGQSRAALAAAPMREVPQEAAIKPGTPATIPAQTIQIPAATTAGEAGVPTGFPHTPEGAVAQLAAIDTTVLPAMSVPFAHDVYEAWSQDGARPAQEWAMTQNIAVFLGSARQMGQEAGEGVRVSAVPVGAQVKGTDGQDWVVACVLLDVQAVIEDRAQIAYGHCEAMTWQEERWVIAAGPAAAPAPSTWPGTETAVKAGWKTWASGENR